MAEDEVLKFPVKELIEQCYEAFEIPRHVAAGAVTLAGAGPDDLLSVEEFKALVEAFLNHPIA